VEVEEAELIGSGFELTVSALVGVYCSKGNDDSEKPMLEPMMFDSPEKSFKIDRPPVPLRSRIVTILMFFVNLFNVIAFVSYGFVRRIR
jgi:hypothetical protein